MGHKPSEMSGVGIKWIGPDTLEEKCEQEKIWLQVLGNQSGAWWIQPAQMYIFTRTWVISDWLGIAIQTKQARDVAVKTVLMVPQHPFQEKKLWTYPRNYQCRLHPNLLVKEDVIVDCWQWAVVSSCTRVSKHVYLIVDIWFHSHGILAILFS